MKSLWTSTSVPLRLVLLFAVAVILFGSLFFGYKVFTPEQGILFSGLNPRDSATITSELERQKIPFSLGDEGTAILMRADEVPKTRLKLMNKDLPLNGAVGYELFNKTDFSTTDFVQKVNLQRAIQGELSRTILAIDSVQSVRVHLAMPEQGTFKRNVQRAKASVVIVLKPDMQLGREQILGVQRLVSASVPDLAADDVSVLDQRGVLRSRASNANESEVIGDAALDLKRGTEDYLFKKVQTVLDTALGAGKGIAIIDVSLNLDRNRVTKEEVLAAPGRGANGVPAGVMTRSRSSSRENGVPLDTTPSSSFAKGQTITTSALSTQDADYQTGRRVEENIAAPGSIKRLSIAVVLRKGLTEGQMDQIRNLVSAATGFNRARGDVIVVHSFDPIAHDQAMGVPPSLGGLASLPSPTAVTSSARPSNERDIPAKSESQKLMVGSSLMWWLIPIIICLGFLFRYLISKTNNRFTGSEREAALKTMKQWLQDPKAS